MIYINSYGIIRYTKLSHESILKGELIMSLNRKTPRETRKFFFPNPTQRDAAKKTLDTNFPDVHIQKIMGTSLLVNLTDSQIYDTKVIESIEALGGQIVPV